MDEQLQLTLTDSGNDVHYVRLCGEIDMSSSSELEERLIEIAWSRIELDVSELTFIDSAGVHALTNVDTALRRRQKSLALLGVRENVKRVLEILGKEKWVVA